MSTRIYECPLCKQLLGLDDTDDDLKKIKKCPKCSSDMKHRYTVGTSIKEPKYPTFSGLIDLKDYKKESQ